MVKLKKYYYVYESSESKENGRKYIGYRGCDCEPEEDTKYFGSFSDTSFEPDQKTILFVSLDIEEALLMEITLQKALRVVENSEYANKAYQTSTSFYYSEVSEETKTLLKQQRNTPEAIERNRQSTLTRFLDPIFREKHREATTRANRQIAKNLITRERQKESRLAHLAKPSAKKKFVDGCRKNAKMYIWYHPDLKVIIAPIFQMVNLYGGFNQNWCSVAKGKTLTIKRWSCIGCLLSTFGEFQNEQN